MDRAAITEKIKQSALILAVPPEWLDGVIAFETAGTYDPCIVSPRPYNQYLLDTGKADVPLYAKGLIQFIDSTAQWLGFRDSQDLIDNLPDFDSQMDGAVVPYFRKYMPFSSEQDFYMTVFYPAYRKVPPETVFPDSVQRSNPGIKTVQDYVDFVDFTIAKNRILPIAGGAAALLLAVGLAWYLFFK
jgi:hypothetical protein